MILVCREGDGNISISPPLLFARLIWGRRKGHWGTTIDVRMVFGKTKHIPCFVTKVTGRKSNLVYQRRRLDFASNHSFEERP